MTRDEFRHSVEAAARQLPAQWRERALQHHLDYGRCSSPAHVRECHALATLLAEANKLPGAAGGLEPHAFPAKPNARIVEEQLLGAVEEKVRQIRQAIFGSPHARFTPEQYTQAVEWMEEVAEKAIRRLTPEEFRRCNELEFEIRERTQELARLQEMDWTRQWLRPQVRYVKPGVTYSTVPLYAGSASPLLPLVRGISEIAEATGFREPALVAYVLCGITPPWPRILWGVKSMVREFLDGTRIERQEATITLNDLTVSVQDIQRILQRLRKEHGESRENTALCIILQRLGGVPPKPPLSFWREVVREWIGEGLEIHSSGPGAYDMDKAARALSRRFRRLPPEQQNALRQRPSTTRLRHR